MWAEWGKWLGRRQKSFWGKGNDLHHHCDV